jgi:hypothetical protein
MFDCVADFSAVDDTFAVDAPTRMVFAFDEDFHFFSL